MAPPPLDNGNNEDGAQGENEAGGQAVHRGSVEEFFSRWQDVGCEENAGCWVIKFPLIS
jgi:hypothetical protein